MGIVLEVLDRLRAGARLYSGVFWQYGPVAILPFLAERGLRPVGPFEYCVMNIVIVTLGLGILSWLLDRAIERRVAIPSLLLLFLPSWGVAGPAYFAPQFLLLVLLAAVWRPAMSRSMQRSGLCGVLLACLHLNKFGTDVQAGVAILILDILHARSAQPAQPATRILRGELPLAAGYVAALAMAALGLWLAGMNGAQLIDAFLPLHMLGIYRGLDLDQSIIQHIVHSSPRYLVGSIAPWFAGLGFLLVIARSARDEDAPISAVSILPWTFVVGAATVFRLVFHYLMHANYLLLAIPLALRRVSTAARWGLVLVCAPWIFVGARSIWLSVGVSDTVPVATPRGLDLWGPRAQAAGLHELFDMVGNRLRGKVGTVFTRSDRQHNAGLYFFLDSQAATRHLFLVPESVPEGERDLFVKEILSGEWILVSVPPDGDYRDGLRGTNLLDPGRLELLAESTRQCALTLNEPRMALIVPRSRSCP